MRSRLIKPDLALGDLDKVGAADPRLVGIVKHDAAVPEKRAEALDRRRVQVNVVAAERPGALGDLAKLAAQVAHLARLGQRRVADGLLGPEEGVEVRERGGAVAVVGDGRDVQVVHCGSGVLVRRERGVGAGEVCTH